MGILDYYGGRDNLYTFFGRKRTKWRVGLIIKTKIMFDFLLGVGISLLVVIILTNFVLERLK